MVTHVMIEFHIQDYYPDCQWGMEYSFWLAGHLGVWDKVVYQLPKCWDCVSNFISHFALDVAIYPYMY